jgi:hypothetical protein
MGNTAPKKLTVGKKGKGEVSGPKESAKEQISVFVSVCLN